MALGLALALAGPSGTATAIKGDLEVHQMQAHGASILDAKLVVLLQAAIGEGSAAADFQLEADSLRVERDMSEPTFHVGVTNVIAPTATTTSQNYSTASVQGTGNRANHRFVLAPIDGSSSPSIRVETVCFSQEASGQDSLTRYPRAQEIRNRPARFFDTENSLRWETCSGDASMTVTGDFELSLWEWDAALKSDEGATSMIVVLDP